jgi:hypothetical protein
MFNIRYLFLSALVVFVATTVYASHTGVENSTTTVHSNGFKDIWDDLFGGHSSANSATVSYINIFSTLLVALFSIMLSQ